MSKPSTTLFMDWNDIDTGRLQPTLDPARLSEEGRKQVEIFDREHHLHFPLTGHGTRRLRLPHGVKITIEKAQKSEPWLMPEHPWEQVLNFPTVIQEEGRYRCWYGASSGGKKELVFDGERGVETKGSSLCYAESEDGFHWTKPSVGVHSFMGSKDNNIASEYFHTASVFRDDSADPSERYKFFHFAEIPDAPKDSDLPGYGLYGAVSPDGFHWTPTEQPLIRYFCDTQNIGSWDPINEEYVGYFRSHISGRSISRSATKDFRDWPHPVTILYPGSEEDPATDYYTSCYTCYPDDPSLKLMFPALFHHNSDSVSVRLALSRNGHHFSWVSREPVIEVGGLDAFDSGSMYANPNLVRLPDGRLALPYQGIRMGHDEGWYGVFYEHCEGKGEISFAWAIWEDGRLAGIEAEDYGEFWTKAALFEGDAIHLNARTGRVGKVEIEIWNERGEEALPGFSFSECAPFAGDGIWTPCQWKGDLQSLKGRKIQLRYRLSIAKVFGCRFV